MVQGVQHSKAVLQAVSELAQHGIAIAKRGGGLSSLTKIFAVMSDLKDLVAQAPQALPELLDLDAQESGELAQAAYQMVKDIVLSVKA